MSRLIAELTDRLGAGAVLTGSDVASQSAGVWSAGEPVKADVYVRPGDTSEVAFVLRLCHAAGQRVIVHGGRTGLVGATHSGPGDLVLSLERLNRIEEVDTIGRTLTAGAGVTLQAAQEAAAAHGLLLPLDMGSRGSATLGGAAATNAGGNRVLRFGMTRALVLGLEGVLPDGTVISALNRMLKNNAGFDLKQLLIGTEGTLGVITRLVFRLVPRPSTCQTALVSLRDFHSMHQLLNELDRELGGTLSAFEAMWRDYMEFVAAPGMGHRPPLGTKYPYYVLIEAEGSDARNDDDRFAAALASAQARGVAADAVIAKSERERAALWAIRDDVMRLTELRPLFMFDVSVPRAVMESYVTTVRDGVAQNWPDARMFTFGHLADGNLHFAISAGRPAGQDREAVERVVYESLTGIGGSISAEHGIGLEKKGYLGLSRTGAELELMRTLKKTLDPHGILNPGRVVDVS